MLIGIRSNNPDLLNLGMWIGRILVLIWAEIYILH